MGGCCYHYDNLSALQPSLVYALEMSTQQRSSSNVLPLVLSCKVEAMGDNALMVSIKGLNSITLPFQVNILISGL